MPSSALSTVSKPRMSSNEIARQWLVKFAEVCQKDFSSALAAIWAEQLCDLDPNLLERSCDRLMRKWTSGFLPVPGNIRELADEELRVVEFQKLQKQEEEQRCAALADHQRAIAYAEHKRQQRLLGPPPESVIDMTDASPIRETPRVIDFEGRAAELQRQAEIIRQKYPEPGNSAGIPPELRPVEMEAAP